MTPFKNILFVCSANKRRSKTAEDFFAEKHPEFSIESAGTNIRMCQREGTNPITADILEWADLILVMENRHKKELTHFSKEKYDYKIKILHIPDRYNYGQPELIELLQTKTARFFLERIN